MFAFVNRIAWQCSLQNFSSPVRFAIDRTGNCTISAVRGGFRRGALTGIVVGSDTSKDTGLDFAELLHQRARSLPDHVLVLLDVEMVDFGVVS